MLLCVGWLVFLWGFDFVALVFVMLISFFSQITAEVFKREIKTRDVAHLALSAYVWVYRKPEMPGLIHLESR